MNTKEKEELLKLFNNYKEIPAWMQARGQTTEEALQSYYTEQSKSNYKQMQERQKKKQEEEQKEVIETVKEEITEHIKDALIEALTKGKSKITVKK